VVRVAVTVIGTNLVMDYGTHEAAIAAMESMQNEPPVAWTTTRELYIEKGPVVIAQTRTDPGDIGEPRIVQFDGVTHVCVPDFDRWPVEPVTDR
jgi:hypothetical protein